MEYDNTDVTRVSAQLQPRSSDRRIIATLANDLTAENLRHAADSGIALPGRDAVKSKEIFNAAIATRILRSEEENNPYLGRGEVLKTAMYIAPVILLALALAAYGYLTSIN